MNNQATMEKMQLMKMSGMLRAFQNTMEVNIKNNFTADELIGHLIDVEYDERKNKKFQRLIQHAKFRYKAVFEEIDFQLKRNLNKNEILRLSDCNWIKTGKNVIITGPAGTGKSFLACALGHQACAYHHKVLYFSFMKLMSGLKQACADGTDFKEMKKISNAAVLIIDDFALQKLDIQNRLKLFEILEDRHGLKSTIIVSQRPISKWHDIIDDATIADAICDRLVHTSLRINLKGGKDSLRKTKESVKKSG